MALLDERGLDESVQVLRRLGLTIDQARVYLTLVQVGLSTAKTISQASRVTLQDVYRVMPTLQKLGLAEKAVTIPVKFQAIPIQLGLSILLHRRSEATHELETSMKELLQNFKKNNARMPIQGEEPRFVLIPGGEAASERVKLSIENSQTSLDVITSINRLSGTVSAHGEALKKAMNRGVKIRIITGKPENQDTLPKTERDLIKESSCEIKCSATHPIMAVAICDDKEALISTLLIAGSKRAPELLFSTSPSLIELSQNYFETLWTTLPNLAQFSQGISP